jgi:hypothetical protein
MRARRESQALWHRGMFHLPFGARFDPLSWPAVKAAAECSSFSAFLRHEEAIKDLGMLPQWRSVSDADNGRLIVDAIGRYESLEDDFYQIQKQLGLPPAAIHSRNVSDQWEVQVSETDLALLEERYRDDMSRFGYRLESSLAPPQILRPTN